MKLIANLVEYTHGGEIPNDKQILIEEFKLSESTANLVMYHCFNQNTGESCKNQNYY